MLTGELRSVLGVTAIFRNFRYVKTFGALGPPRGRIHPDTYRGRR